MKILHINAVYGVGSTGTIVQDIHNMCLARNIDSYVAFSSSACGEIVNGYRIGKPLGKKIHALLARFGGKQAYFSRFSTAKLIKHIDKIRPDIVHLHNLHSNYINLNKILDYLAAKKIKTVITLHDCWFYTGGCFHYTSANCNKWRAECGNCPKKRMDTPAYIKDNSQKILSDRKKHFNQIENLTVVGVSEWITKECENSVISAKRYETVYNGIDTEFFAPTSSNIKQKLGIDGKFVVLATANKWLLPINAETLETVSKGIGDDSVILMVGAEGQAQDLLPQNVIPYKYIKNKNELREIYSVADVFANCTREESLSLVNVEAQACGTPVVTYKNTGAKETVDGISGFSVESGNTTEFLESILKIKQNGKKAYSEKCREYVLQKFNRENNYEKLLKLYSEI